MTDKICANCNHCFISMAGLWCELTMNLVVRSMTCEKWKTKGDVE